jgi:hypothetical protein
MRVNLSVAAPICYLAIFLVSFGVRVSLDAPGISPDGWMYLRMAENISLNGCYSESPPADAPCIPYWGPKQPGYPVFIAVIKAFSNSLVGIVIFQSLLVSAAITYTICCAVPFFRNLAGATLAGFVLALSPLTVPYSDWLLTETLAVAASLWVVAECLRSLATRRFRTAHISFAILIAVFIRWDLIWLFLPITIVAYTLLDLRSAIYKLVGVLCVVSVPILLLILKAVVAGLPPVPRLLSASDDQVPPGIVAFWKATAVSVRAARGLVWPVWGRNYDAIEKRFHDGSVSKRVDREGLGSALKALSKVPNGQPVPNHVDESFALLARDFTSNNPYYARFIIPVERAIAIWTEADRVSSMTNYGAVAPHITLYWLSLLSLTLAAVAFFRSQTLELAFITGILMFIFCRTGFLVSLGALETRYLVPFFPLMELASALFLTRFFIRRGDKGNHRPSELA